MRSRRKNAPTHQPAATRAMQTEAPLDDGAVTWAVIQALIPLGLRAVKGALQHEVTALDGAG